MSNEITVRITCTLQEMCNILKNKGFSIVDKYNLEDIYYTKKDVHISKENAREILKKCVLIRKVTQFIPQDFKKSYTELKLTLKNKQIDNDGTIIKQEKIECKIKDIEQGKEFIKALEYKEFMTIKEKDIVYEKDHLKLAIKDIENGENLIEIETIEDNLDFDTTDKLIKKINELKIPINTEDYYVKKAEIELKKSL
ncbi:unknown [Clostridium sp. CAG:440]|nr:unknown [Clostridium sp. CAG:440]